MLYRYRIKKYTRTNEVVGIDLGLIDFATFSNGIKISNPRFMKTQKRNLLNSKENYREKQSVVIDGTKQESELRN